MLGPPQAGTRHDISLVPSPARCTLPGGCPTWQPWRTVPAENILQDSPPGLKDANVLLLEAGDLHDLLLTVGQFKGQLLTAYHHNSQPVVRARNALLLTIAADIDPSNRSDVHFLWNVWHNIYWDGETRQRFERYVKKLLAVRPVSSSTQTPPASPGVPGSVTDSARPRWVTGPGDSFIALPPLLEEMRKVWEWWLQPLAKPNPARLAATRRDYMKKHWRHSPRLVPLPDGPDTKTPSGEWDLDNTLKLFSYVHATSLMGPRPEQREKDPNMVIALATVQWDLEAWLMHGAVTDSGAMPLLEAAAINPTLLQPGTGEWCVQHDCHPFAAFQPLTLEAVVRDLRKATGRKQLSDLPDESAGSNVRICCARLAEMTQHFQKVLKAKKAVVILFDGDPLQACHSLPFSETQLDVIHAWDLADRVGLLNVLTIAGRKLHPSPVARLRTGLHAWHNYSSDPKASMQQCLEASTGIPTALCPTLLGVRLITDLELGRPQPWDAILPRSQPDASDPRMLVWAPVLELPYPRPQLTVAKSLQHADASSTSLAVSSNSVSMQSQSSAQSSSQSKATAQAGDISTVLCALMARCGLLSNAGKDQGVDCGLKTNTPQTLAYLLASASPRLDLTSCTTRTPPNRQPLVDNLVACLGTFLDAALQLPVPCQFGLSWRATFSLFSACLNHLSGSNPQGPLADMPTTGSSPSCLRSQSSSCLSLAGNLPVPHYFAGQLIMHFSQMFHAADQPPRSSVSVRLLLAPTAQIQESYEAAMTNMQRKGACMTPAGCLCLTPTAETHFLDAITCHLEGSTYQVSFLLPSDHGLSLADTSVVLMDISQPDAPLQLSVPAPLSVLALHTGWLTRHAADYISLVRTLLQLDSSNRPLLLATVADADETDSSKGSASAAAGKSPTKAAVNDKGSGSSATQPVPAGIQVASHVAGAAEEGILVVTSMAEDADNYNLAVEMRMADQEFEGVEGAELLSLPPPNCRMTHKLQLLVKHKKTPRHLTLITVCPVHVEVAQLHLCRRHRDISITLPKMLMMWPADSLVLHAVPSLCTDDLPVWPNPMANGLVHDIKSMFDDKTEIEYDSDMSPLHRAKRIVKDILIATVTEGVELHMVRTSAVARTGDALSHRLYIRTQPPLRRARGSQAILPLFYVNMDEAEALIRARHYSKSQCQDDIARLVLKSKHGSGCAGLDHVAAPPTLDCLLRLLQCWSRRTIATAWQKQNLPLGLHSPWHVANLTPHYPDRYKASPRVRDLPSYSATSSAACQITEQKRTSSTAPQAAAGKPGSTPAASSAKSGAAAGTAASSLQHGAAAASSAGVDGDASAAGSGFKFTFAGSKSPSKASASAANPTTAMTGKGGGSNIPSAAIPTSSGMQPSSSDAANKAALTTDVGQVLELLIASGNTKPPDRVYTDSHDVKQHAVAVWSGRPRPVPRPPAMVDDVFVAAGLRPPAGPKYDATSIPALTELVRQRSGISTEHNSRLADILQTFYEQVTQGVEESVAMQGAVMALQNIPGAQDGLVRHQLHQPEGLSHLMQQAQRRTDPSTSPGELTSTPAASQSASVAAAPATTSTTSASTSSTRADQASTPAKAATAVATSTSSVFVCSSCGRQGPDMLRCGRCFTATYCNPTCQRVHWPEHKQLCKKR